MKKSFVLGVLAASILSGCYDTGSGDKVGSVVKLAKQGVFCKTWEGEIIRGGMANGSGATGTAFHFTVDNDDLAKKIDHYLNTQQEVKLTYRMEFATFCRSDSPSNAFVTAVEPLSAAAARPLKVEPVTVKPEAKEPASSKEDKIRALLKAQEDLLREIMK